MESLTPEGRTLVEQVAQRRNVGTDAVLALLRALDRGGGTQAQFSHPELGGMGQWSRGGMIMVGDMFNNGLKAHVDSLCNELSDALRTTRMFAPETRDSSSSGGSSRSGSWWPPACGGSPSSSGSQNDMRYAYFPATRRLAIHRNGVVRVYDTGGHQIGGVSQQQSGSQDLTFTSQYGTVRLHELALVSDGGQATVQGQAAPSGDTFQPAQTFPTQTFDEGTFHDEPAPSRASTQSTSFSRDNDVFGKIERLHDLQRKGILSEAEFAEKKKELLARI